MTSNLRGCAMPPRVTNDMLDACLRCRTKGYLKLAGEQGTQSDYTAVSAGLRAETLPHSLSLWLGLLESRAKLQKAAVHCPSDRNIATSDQLRSASPVFHVPPPFDAWLIFATSGFWPRDRIPALITVDSGPG